MDLNITVLCGRLATKPEIRTYDSGTTSAKLLITVRSEKPRHRIDVIPVSWWDYDNDTIANLERGDRVWVAGSVQRRFWSADTGRRSVVEVTALDVQRFHEETLNETG